MIIKALCAVSGMALLHILFKSIGYTGISATLFTFSIPLVLWYWFETRNREDNWFDHLLEILDYIDIFDILEGVKKRLF